MSLATIAEMAAFRLEERPDREWYWGDRYVVRCLKSGRIVYRSLEKAKRDRWAKEFLSMIGYRAEVENAQ